MFSGERSEETEWGRKVWGRVQNPKSALVCLWGKEMEGALEHKLVSIIVPVEVEGSTMSTPSSLLTTGESPG